MNKLLLKINKFLINWKGIRRVFHKGKTVTMKIYVRGCEYPLIKHIQPKFVEDCFIIDGPTRAKRIINSNNPIKMDNETYLERSEITKIQLDIHKAKEYELKPRQNLDFDSFLFSGSLFFAVVIIPFLIFTGFCVFTDIPLNEAAAVSSAFIIIGVCSPLFLCLIAPDSLYPTEEQIDEQIKEKLNE